MADYCKHELPLAVCDICTPRQAPVPKKVSNAASSPAVENADTVIVAANVAWGEYEKYSAYVCQPDRAFRQDARWMGFYAEEHIQRSVPEIEYVRDRVPFTKEEIDRLRAKGDPISLRTADLIDVLVKKSSRKLGQDFKVFLLSSPDDSRTVQLPSRIKNSSLNSSGSGTAYTQHQRYTRLDALQAGPSNTDELIQLERSGLKR